MNFDDAYLFAINLLESKLPKYLTYHNVEHTQRVVDAASSLALGEKVDTESLILVKTAAAFHDTGFTEAYHDNEPIGAKIATSALPQFGYSEKQIQIISRLILATKFPQEPKTALERIICDADLSYIGKEYFHDIAENLKEEFLHMNIVKTDLDWLKLQVSFLENCQFHTETGRKQGEKQYLINLAQARKNL